MCGAVGVVRCLRGAPTAIVAGVLAAGLLGACTSSPKPVATAAASSVTASATTVTTVPLPSPSRPITTVARPPRSHPTTTAAPPVPSVSVQPSSGSVVVLNPGHNGGNASDPAAINRQVPAGFGEYKACDTTGTNADAGYPEHAFNWDVTLRVRAILQARGVRVVLTRSNDTGVGPCVDQRAAIGNAAGVAAVISIHSDGAPPQDHGFHVCYDSRPPAGPAVDAQSRRLSTAIHDALLRGSGLVPAAYIGDGNGYFPRSDLAGLNLAIHPATFLEIGNMRNAGDADFESSVAGRAQIAAAVASGILAYLGK